MGLKRAARIVLPLFIALAAMVGLYINASISYATMPHVKSGVLNLAQWNQKSVFEIVGEWEFYWGKALTCTQIKSGAENFTIVEAPGVWNHYETEFGELPGFGLATYHIRVTGAIPGEEYGMRIQDQASAYRLYVNNELIAQNGSFGDTADAPALAYRPQLAAFTPQAGSFDIILQISNHAYAGGGMWEPLIFGTYEQISSFNGTLSAVSMAAFGGIAFICLFFFIFYVVRRQEKDVLILAGIGALMLIRLTIFGDMLVTHILSIMPIAGFGWIDYLTMLWIQFLLLYFIYYTYGGIVRKWQVAVLLSYCALVSLGVILLPFEVIMSAYMVLNFILLFVLAFVTVQLAQAAWRGQTGASVLLFAMALILLFVFYDMFVNDWSVGHYLISAASIEYMILCVAHCTVVAKRYHRAQQLEISFLKSQIRPHFIHNSLACIINLSRSDADRACDLLTEFSSYLRGYYDYDSEEQIALGQELEIVQAYVALEQARFGERVQVRYEIESESLLLPPLSLQPLVENAFVHGLREKADGGTMLVYARRTNRGNALIGVRDNGVGLRTKTLSERQGVGIENINRRLARLYRTQLAFSVPEGGGCEVSMKIPWKEADKGARIYR